MNHSLNMLKIIAEKEGPAQITKPSFPLVYGKYSEIRTLDYEFRFNLNGEIKFIRGLKPSWPHPAEQLKRTDGNDWVYYTVGDAGGEKGLKSWLGEYYLPCLPYPSNPIWEVNYFANPDIMTAFAAWTQLYADLYCGSTAGLHPRVVELIDRIKSSDDRTLYERARELNAIIGGRASVLPPDTRHFDYEVIPLNIADGCLYHCDFCCVKSARPFRARGVDEILEQIRRLKILYGRNIENYHAIYLGDHDALQAGAELIRLAASESYETFNMSKARGVTPSLFLFASVHSLLGMDGRAFEQLNQLPFYTYINVGFESIYGPTLKSIGKPVDESMVSEAFQKMLEVNAAYSNSEITGNFLIGETLPPEHYQSLSELLGAGSIPSSGKGCVYLSPLKDSPKKRELLPWFYEIKSQSRLPVFMYLIQRL